MTSPYPSQDDVQETLNTCHTRLQLNPPLQPATRYDQGVADAIKWLMLDNAYQHSSYEKGIVDTIDWLLLGGAHPFESDLIEEK